jgi:lipid II:glycine glycyltransferase (peptidoglycan interpeptide bridge formation enzyme)
MIFSDINQDYSTIFNESVIHPLQAFEWGQFREKTGVKVVRRGQIGKNKINNPYQITVHQTPGFPYLIGYFPKGEIPTSELLLDLKQVGKDKHLSFIQIEPNIQKDQSSIVDSQLKRSFHPLFTKYTFIIDLTKSEDELLSNMKQKTRYNVRLSEKKGVKFIIDNSEKAFTQYLKLTKDTTDRQKFYAHSEDYHKKMWETLHADTKDTIEPNKLQAHLLTAYYNKKTLATWILFTFKDTLYYPYGASSNENREVMASTGITWAAIKYGKRLGLKKFDMWGAANVPDPKPDDPYYGFHHFKEGFGATLTEFVGSFDLVINPSNYRLLTMADKIRWAYLKARKN